jgi:Zn-dependent alcohol dehydrogenase
MTYYGEILTPSLSHIAIFGLVCVGLAVLQSAITKGANLLREWVTTERGRALIDFVEHLAQTIVASLAQTEVPKYRQATLDGKLTEQQRKQLLQEALARMHAAIGQEALRQLDKLTGTMSLDEYLRAQIEAAVRADKRGDLVAVLNQRASNPPQETQVKQ